MQQIYFTMNEKIILQVLAEQQEYKERYKKNTWISRKEEDLFEFGSNMAQSAARTTYPICIRRF